jgi:hypothetical protein
VLELGHKFAGQRRMQSMPTAVRDDVTDNLTAREGHVSDHVEQLVPRTFIGES